MPQELVYTIAQIIGYIAMVLAVVSMQFKSMRWIIFFQILSNVLLGLQCIVGGTISTGGIVFLAAAQTVISFIYNRYQRPFPLWLTLSFIAGYTAITVIGFISPSVASSPLDLVTMVAVWFFAISIVQKYSYLCRVFLAINVSLWLIYDVCILPSAALNHVIILSSIIVSIIRNDRAEWRALYRGFLAKMRDFSNRD